MLTTGITAADQMRQWEGLSCDGVLVDILKAAEIHGGVDVYIACPWSGQDYM